MIIISIQSNTDVSLLYLCVIFCNKCNKFISMVLGVRPGSTTNDRVASRVREFRQSDRLEVDRV